MKQLTQSFLVRSARGTWTCNVKSEERFWAKVQKSDGCWLWQANILQSGYGQFRVSGKGVRAHRYAYELANGTIPPEICVLHRCDNRRCVRPDHLFLGSNADNTHDMVAKGRAALGEKNGLAKLTALKILEIRNASAQGMSQRALARKYGVSRIAIRAIHRRDTWKHVH